ncbi:hypothetical protein TVAG_127200 [Trichomonas vaginalis G3]|uniref:Uncharacterized protein n=1 Tax=Trichomonas vaginalis (strain ATCC PRA-98 / G3) TaxID=412133 RepID=A2E7Y8_TRIV3|nr:WD40 repeat-like family [Trichomonas vaginalis G3]EAY11214.1 hypothetical protein TVAG_127200 [Trichomonas vaginalis G3]KAI5551406.1 WD40 repeat-like family [Trichomonas vaginalis G3]|eukprot:XP_001323437.1 hypothetical protein [Trichomonas vaginalis G3]
MIFLEDFSHILKHINDEVTVDILYNNHINAYLLLSPQSASILKFNDSEPEIKSTFNFTTQQLQNDILCAATFIGKLSFACLSSMGKIFYFEIGKQYSVNYVKQIMIKENVHFTSISSYNGFIAAGDNQGNFRLISTESVNSDNFCISISFKVCEWPIKHLSLSSRKGIILCADGSTKLFSIDRTILSNSKYELKSAIIHTSGVSLVAASPKSPYIAQYLPSGVLHITNFKNFDQKINGCPQIFSFAFSSDGQTIIGATHEGFIAWSSRCQRLRYLTSRDIANSRCICASPSYLLASINSGIAVIPLLISPMNRSPLLFTGDKIIEARSSTNGCIALSHHPKDVGTIINCASGEDGRLIAVVGQNGFSLFAKATANWHTPIIKGRYQLKDVDFMDKVLCITALSLNEVKYVLLLAKSTVTRNLEIIKTFPLDGCPVSIRASSESVCVAYGKTVIMVDALFNQTKIVLKEDIICAEPVSPTTCVVLTKDFNLLYYANEKETKLLSNIMSFFIDSKNKIIFAHNEFKMLAAKIPEFDFVTIKESEDIPIGIIPDLFALVTIEPGSTLPLHPVLTYFFNKKLIEEEKSVKIISMSPFSQTILMQIAANASRGGNIGEVIPFLKKFPQNWPIIITALLRTLEPPDREEAFKIIGRPTDLFCEFTQCKIEENNNQDANISERIPHFICEEKPNEECLHRGSLVLELIFAGDGVPPALSAALFLLENSTDVSDDFLRAVNVFVAAAKEIPEKPQGLTDLIEKAEKLLNK